MTNFTDPASELKNFMSIALNSKESDSYTYSNIHKAMSGEFKTSDVLFIISTVHSRFDKLSLIINNDDKLKLFHSDINTAIKFLQNSIHPNNLGRKNNNPVNVELRNSAVKALDIASLRLAETNKIPILEKEEKDELINNIINITKELDSNTFYEEILREYSRVILVSLRNFPFFGHAAISERLYLFGGVTSKILKSSDINEEKSNKIISLFKRTLEIFDAFNTANDSIENISGLIDKL